MESIAAKNVLVAGCGRLGVSVGQLLHSRGYHVYGLRRRAEAVPEPLIGIAVDLCSPVASWPELPQADTVIYAAAATERGPEAYQRAYVTGVEHTMVALQTQGQSPRRIIHVSSTGVYPQQQGEWVDESSPANPASPTGQALRAGELAWQNGPWPATILRLAGIYGPSRQSLLQSVQQRSAQLYGHLDAFSNRIHESDAAKIISELVEHPKAPGVVIGVDTEPAPYDAVVTWLASQLKIPISELAQRARPSARGNKRCRNRALQDLGYNYLYPTFREGYEPLIETINDQHES